MTRSKSAVLLAVALVAPAAPGVRAQVLLERDGIELRGRATVVEGGAGTCFVSEERESAASYERKKGNDGERVDLWRMDFSVYNGSGEPLDHLVADYRIVSENPPCSDWSWPDAERHPGLIGWGNVAGLIQRSGPGNAVPPGETLSDTRYIFALHRHEPRFASGSVDFTFGMDAPAAAPVAASPVSGPPEPICGPRPDSSGCWREVVNRPECHVWVEANLDQTATWSGECSEGYAQGRGTIGLTYGRLVPPTPDRTAHGLLVDGRRQGNWLIRIAPERSWEGPFVDGMKHGYWIEPRENGRVSQGLMRRAKRHGDWVHREPDGTVTRGPWFSDHEGPLRVSLRHGIWTSWSPDGTVDRWSMIRGSEEGSRIRWEPDGTVGRFSFAGGERHGLTIFCYPRPGTTLMRLEIHQNDELKATYESLGSIHDPALMNRVVSECGRLLTLERPESPR